MGIRNIDAFDLYEDGETVVVKTNVEEADDQSNLRFAWYVFFGSSVVKKTGYQRKPYTFFKAEHLGRYKIKAFVRDKEGENKEEVECFFAADKKNSPLLFEKLDGDKQLYTPRITLISDEYYRFDIQGEIPEGSVSAWYVYTETSDDPIYKTEYSSVHETLYRFEKGNKYRVKLFVKNGGYKTSVMTDIFAV